MFAGAANGNILPPYVVYKSGKLWDQWIVGGPKNARYGHTLSGWFDANTFIDWFKNIVVPYCKANDPDNNQVLIGDNLSSHLFLEVTRLCAEYKIWFCFLPKNSTDKT